MQTTTTTTRYGILNVKNLHLILPGEPELWQQQQPGDQLEPKRGQQLQPDVSAWEEKEKASSSVSFSCF